MLRHHSQWDRFQRPHEIHQLIIVSIRSLLIIHLERLSMIINEIINPYHQFILTVVERDR